MKISEKQLKKYINEVVTSLINEEETQENEKESMDSNEEQVETQEKSEDSDFKSIIIKMLGQLESVHVVLKELHWAADKHAEHVLLDEIDGDILGLLDEVAEIAMGLLDEKFGRGDLKVEECDCSDCESALKRIEEIVIEAKNGIGDEMKYSGLQSVLDDFLSKINKWNYLRKLV